MNRKWIVPMVVVALSGVTLWGVSHAAAQTETKQTLSIIQRLAERFGLQEADVVQVFEEERDDRQAEMEARLNEQLDKLVTDGELTAVQKEAILAKRTELQASALANTEKAKPEDLQNMTDTERKAQMESRRQEMEARKTELENWAEEQGIDVKYLGLVFGCGHRGFDGGHGPMMGEFPMGQPRE